MLDVVRRLGNADASRCTLEQFDTLYERSIKESDGFWLEQAKRLDWFDEPSRAGEWSYDPVEIAWFADGKLNLCHNAVDRHLDRYGDDTAIIFEPDDPQADGRTLTYRQLHAEVVAMANALKAIGVKRGDRVTIYMPMIVEGVLALLACARLGAVHSVVFGGFSPEALAGRIEGCGSRFVVTADEVPDPQNLPIRLWVQGDLRQDYNTNDMGNTIEESIEYVSAIESVSPGVVFYLGTNHQGLGAMQDGDNIEITIEQIGSFSFNVSDPLKRKWAKGVDQETAKAVREGTSGPGRNVRPL